MQRKMQELFLQQKEKGGIIDLEEEGRKYLVVTNSPTSPDQTFTELSPTDYQLGKFTTSRRFSTERRNLLILLDLNRIG